MTSSEEDSAYRAMEQPAATRVTKHQDTIYRERFQRRSEVVDMVGEEQDSDDWEAWRGNESTTRETRARSAGEDLDDPEVLSSREISDLPLGIVGHNLHDNVHEGTSSNSSPEPTGRRRSARKQTKRKKKPPRCHDDSDFIVSDGEIDPPSKSEKKRGRKPAHKRKTDHKGKTSMERDEMEEEQPMKKRGRKNEEVIDPPKKRRGRLPKNRSIEEPLKSNKEKKDDPKTKKSPRTSGRRMNERDDDDDEIEVIEPEKEVRRSGRKEEKRGNKSKKRVESEEEAEADKSRKHIVTSSEDDEEEEEELVKTRKKIGKLLENKKKNAKMAGSSDSEDSVMKGAKNQRRQHASLNINMDSLFEDSGSEDRHKKKQSTTKEERREGRKRKKSNTEESEEDEDRTTEDELDMPSTSASTGKRSRSKKDERNAKSAREIHLKKEKQRKKRQKKVDEKRKLAEAEERAKMKRQAAEDNRVRLVQRRNQRPEDSFQASAMDYQEYFVSRSGSRSPSRSRAPSTVGSRSVSREGSPERRGTGPMDGLDPEKLARRLKIQKMKQEQQIENEKKEKERERAEREREQREKNGQSTAPAAPLNPHEKIRVKPKVFMRGGRDAGILDSAPKKGGGRTRQSSAILASLNPPEASRSSIDLLDEITFEMHKKLPSAPSIDRGRNDPVPMATPRIRMYPSDSPMEQRERERRTGLEDTGANAIDHSRPPSAAHGSMARMRPDPRGPSPMATAPLPTVPSTGNDSMDSPSSMPLDCPSVSNDFPDPLLSPLHEEVDHFAAPASPDMNGPASPDPMENGNDDERDGSFNGGDDSNPLAHKSALEHARNGGHYDEEGDKIRVNDILSSMADQLERGHYKDVLWALNRKFERDSVCHFDRAVNREFIFELIGYGSAPSRELLDGLSKIIQWDEHHCNRERRIDRSQHIGDVHPDASVSFAVIPLIEERRGFGQTRTTPLAEAVLINKLDWAEYLLKAGANVNEKVHFPAFSGYIVQLAIENSSKKDPQDCFNMVSLLLAFGANRVIALECVESMKRHTMLQDTSLTESGFHQLVPHYDRLHQLLYVACDSVCRAFKSPLQRHHGLTRDFVIDGVEEPTCSLPYMTHLTIRLENHVQHFQNPRNSHLLPVFAVVVGMSPSDVMARNEDRLKWMSPQVNSIKLDHRTDELPFGLYPCGIMAEDDEREPKMNRVPLMPLDDNMSIFVIPPQLYPRLKSLVAYIEPTIVRPQTIIFGCLVRLFLKGEATKEKVADALLHLRGSSGEQYDGLD